MAVVFFIYEFRLLSLCGLHFGSFSPVNVHIFIYKKQQKLINSMLVLMQGNLLNLDFKLSPCVECRIFLGGGNLQASEL